MERVELENRIEELSDGIEGLCYHNRQKLKHSQDLKDLSPINYSETKSNLAPVKENSTTTDNVVMPRSKNRSITQVARTNFAKSNHFSRPLSIPLNNNSSSMGSLQYNCGSDSRLPISAPPLTKHPPASKFSERKKYKLKHPLLHYASVPESLINSDTFKVKGDRLSHSDDFSEVSIQRDKQKLPMSKLASPKRSSTSYLECKGTISHSLV